jgi:hypothetical protein
MSKVDGVLAVSIAIDPTDAHVEASRPELLRQMEQRLSLLARHHGSLARTTRPHRPAFIVHRALLAEFSSEPSALRLPVSIEKPKR